MKKTVERTIDICDNCGSDNSVFYHCYGCGKDFCYKCNESRNVGKEYIHSVYCSGSGDGYFCLACLSQPTPKVNKVLKLYLEIESLQKESKAWVKDFDVRAKKAEAELKNLLPE